MDRKEMEDLGWGGGGGGGGGGREEMERKEMGWGRKWRGRRFEGDGERIHFICTPRIDIALS